MATLCNTWDLSSLNRNWTLAPCTGSEDSLPLNCQGSPGSLYFLTTYNLLFFSLSSSTFIKRLFSWKTQQWPQDWKRSLFILIPKKGNAKEYSNYRTIALISYTSKVMLKILHARLQQYMDCELPDIQAGFRKGRGTIDQIANICWIIEKAREFQKKHLLLLYWLCQSLWLCGSQQTGKFLKRWEYLTTLSVSWETCMQVKKQQLELDMEQQTNSRSGKECLKAVYCHPAYLPSIQSTSYEMLGWVKHKLHRHIQAQSGSPEKYQ